MNEDGERFARNLVHRFKPHMRRERGGGGKRGEKLA